MPSATIIQGTVFEDSGSSLMARVVGPDGANITQAAINSIRCAVIAPGESPIIPALVVADVVFDTLQTDARWTVDTTGYNFRHDLVASALATGDVVYRVEYSFTPVTGEVFHVVFELSTIDLLGS